MILVKQIVTAALIALLLAVAGCSTVDTQPTRPAPVPADQQDVVDDQQEIADDQQQRQQTDESKRKALKIIGGIVAAAASVYVITEYVKMKLYRQSLLWLHSILSLMPQARQGLRH